MTAADSSTEPPPDRPAVDRQVLERMLDLTVHAERALLGEILHCPTRTGTDVRFRTLLKWGLQPGDFYRPYHQQVFAAMVRLAERDAPTTAHTVRAELGRDPDLPPRAAADGLPLADLMSAPGFVDLTIAAVMVLESATRRQAVRWAIRLEQAAEGAGAVPGDLFGLEEQVAVLRRDATRWLRRWHAFPQAVRTRLYGSGEPARPRATAGPGPGAEEALERDLLASVATYPRQLADLGGWFRPEHLGVEWIRELYRIAQNRHAAGARIDPLTLGWLTWRHGLHQHDQLVLLLCQGQPWGQHLATQIHHRAVRVRAHRTAVDLVSAAASTQLTPGDLVNHADQLLCGLQEYASPGPPTQRPEQAAIASSPKSSPTGAAGRQQPRQAAA